MVPHPSQPIGWIAAQNAWKIEVSGIDLMECKLHGQKRVTTTLDKFEKTHPDWSPLQRQKMKDDLN